MPPEEFLDLLKAIIPSIFTTIVLLPITSDTIRVRIIGAKKRAITAAKQELMQVVYGMFSSDQRIDDFTFNKLTESLATKYKVKPEALGSKDEIISSLMHMINTTEALPGATKRYLSTKAKKEYSNYDTCATNTSEYEELSEDTNNRIFNTEDVPKEALQTWQEYVHNSSNFSSNSEETFAKLLSLTCSLLGGAFVFFALFSLQDYFTTTFILIAPCLFSFYLCTNILVSLVSRNQKDLEFFRQLVYKIVLLMILAVLEIIVIAFV